MFIGYRTKDDVIEYNIDKNSYERILGYKNVIFKTYEHMKHIIDDLEFDETKKY